MFGSEVTMRYWWVNQNQTFRYEVAGGLFWVPKNQYKQSP